MVACCLPACLAVCFKLQAIRRGFLDLIFGFRVALCSINVQLFCSIKQVYMCTEFGWKIIKLDCYFFHLNHDSSYLVRRKFINLDFHYFQLKHDSSYLVRRKLIKLDFYYFHLGYFVRSKIIKLNLYYFHLNKGCLVLSFCEGKIKLYFYYLA